MRTSVVSAATGLAVGFVIMGVLGVAAGWTEPDQTVVGPTTTTTAAAIVAPPRPVYFDPREVRVGQAMLVAGPLRMEGDAAVLSYDLETITPLQGAEPGYVGQFAGDPGTPIDPATLTPVFPETWTLRTPSGEVTGETATVTSRSVRFDVPAGFSPSQATALRIESYRIPVPISEVFELSQASPIHQVAPGVSVSLIQVVDQGGQAIVQVEIVSDDAFNRENLTVEGVGSVWASAVREAEGRPRYNLRLTLDEPPDILVLRARGLVWLAVPGPIDVPRAED